MIFIVDKAVTGSTHLVFNSSLLKVVAMAFPNEKIVFISEHSHNALVKQALSNNTEQIDFASLEIKTSHSNGIKKLLQLNTKIFTDFFYFIQCFKRMKKAKESLLILNIPPVSFCSFKLVKCFYPNQKVFLILHGELEYLYYQSCFRESMIGKFYKILFRWKGGKNIKYILLNKIIQERLIRDGYVNENQSIEIDHPYIYNYEISGSALDDSRELVFGNIGGLVIRKNGQKIFDIAELLSREILSKRIRICTIGQVEAVMYQYNNNLVEGIDSESEALTRMDFEERVGNIDYALFFFGEDHFVLRSSGAVMDAFNFCKPIIAIRHPLFLSLFKQFGPLGYLCSDLNEMANLIKDIRLNTARYKQEYNSQIENIKILKKELSLESIAKDFKRQVIDVLGKEGCTI